MYRECDVTLLYTLLKKVNGVPKGIRTPVTAVKGRCPRPLDDGDAEIGLQITDLLFLRKMSRACEAVALSSQKHFLCH